MTGSQNIPRSIAFILLLVFSFSFTPKQYLHDIFASHSDNYGKVVQNLTVQASGFQCDCNNQVVELPYELQPADIYHSPFIDCQQQYVSRILDPIASVVSLRSLRGPPAVM